MSFTPEILKLLEFNKLKEIISSFSFSILGRETILSIVPYKDRNKRKETISLVKGFRLLFSSGRNFPVPDDNDIRPLIKKLEEGAYHLSLNELILAGKITEDYKNVGNFLSKLSSEFRTLSKLGSVLKNLPDLYKKVQGIVDEHGGIKDSASDELRSIRTGFRKMHQKLLRAANKLISEKKRFLQEEIFTTKDKRIVLPVIFSKKNNVPGIVHSTSQTQNTVFIEPIELVEMNNEYATFKLREEREIKRILRRLTENIIENISCYEKSIEEMKKIDMLYSLASFSEEYNYSAPTFSDEMYLSIRGGMHPLLLINKGREEVIPFDIRLGENSKVILISGPNMGGKTVLLKSIGIITLMAYAGMHIPANDDSVIPEIDCIFADIGDEQSIEMNLSTFSSHIKNISIALRNSTERSFVLLDEVGVGTDPEEGMGIAMATLERLAEKGVLTFATTHYGKLKHFVAGKENMENASMDFDSENGVPTYHLSYGIPGSSHGFAIAEKVGFPTELLRKAKSYVDENELKTDELICSLEELMKQVKNNQNIVNEEKEKYNRLFDKYNKKYNEIKSKEKELIKNAKKRTEEIVYATRKEMENLIKTIRESQATKESIMKAKKVISEKIKGFEEEQEIKTEKKFDIGDFVYSNKLKISGVVKEILDGFAKVETEKFRFLAPFNTLEVKIRERKSEDKDIVIVDRNKLNFEINIRGLFVEEAEIRVTKFIDDAVLSGVLTIYIIHGKGSGVLRKAIGTLLKKDKRIDEYRLGYWNEGGSGVTIANLKK
ncbi:endonuclease MutS2 [candidate division WOR-3 bacterium]|nr:endonuclease MutS2 [candidate division WOR-3 bacterium]